MADLRAEWVALSDPWIKEARQGRNPTRRGLLDPPMLTACGDVSGLRVLDSGCGEGRLVRILHERGAAYALGVDLCAPMIEAARQLQRPGQEYRCADVEDLSFLGDASFDLVTSCLNQCDLADFEANTREVFRILRPGGRFVVANLHPMRSAHGGWHREGGQKVHAIVDNYFDESERSWRMMGCDFTNFHRTLATYLNAYIAAGFGMVQLIEPSISDERLADWPELDDEQRVPNFFIVVLRKD